MPACRVRNELRPRNTDRNPERLLDGVPNAVHFDGVLADGFRSDALKARLNKLSE